MLGFHLYLSYSVRLKHLLKHPYRCLGLFPRYIRLDIHTCMLLGAALRNSDFKLDIWIPKRPSLDFRYGMLSCGFGGFVQFYEFGCRQLEQHYRHSTSIL
jgi:hypothetical protein